jgi:hypothetical protein
MPTVTLISVRRLPMKVVRKVNFTSALPDDEKKVAQTPQISCARFV